MKLIKLLTVPAVLLFSLLMAVPASAHTLQKATVTVGCGTDTHAGQVCVTLTGDIEEGNDERFVFFDLFATGSNTALSGEEIVFDIPAFDSKNPAKNHFSQQICFPAVTDSSITSFTVKVVKVSSDSQGQNLSDLTLDFPQPPGAIDFTPDHQPSTAVGSTDKCLAPSPNTPPPPSPNTPTPTANTTAVLASTGGFDFRFPLIGLAVIVAGLALYLVSVSRTRRSTGQK